MKAHKTMWLNKGFQCALKTGFNYSNWFDFKSQEEEQKNLQDLCTKTTPFSSSTCENSNSSSFSAILLGTMLGFLTCGVLLSFFFLIFTIHFRNNRIVKMSSPNLNIMTLLGSNLTYGSAYLFGAEKQNSVTKPSMEILFQARLCLLCIGSSLMFGPILGKSWRLYKVFTQQVPDRRVVTEESLICTMGQGQFCTSKYSDFWLLLFLGYKCSLLIYGAYLAGLTDDLSCPPVNQSLTLIIAIVLVFLSTGLMLVMNNFFYLWHNLVFGFTTGGILVSASTINCLIFIPQIRQWKTFEKQKDDASHMAKYFTSSSKNLQSTMYSDEEIYQLLGEKNSMIQQLAEKNTAIACLQEEVNNAKKQLMRLVAEDDYNVVDSPFPSSPQFLEANSAAICSSMGAENQPRDAFPSGQEVKTWQCPQLPNSQCSPELYAQKGCTDYQEHTGQQIPLDIPARCRLMNDYKKTGDNFSSKDDQAQKLCQYTSTFCIQDPARLSVPNGEAKQGNFSPVISNQLPEVTQIRSKTLQEILQDLSTNCIGITQMSSRGCEQGAAYDMNILCQSQDIDIKERSPCEPGQGKGCPTSPKSLHTVNKMASRMQTNCRSLFGAAVSGTEDGNSLHQLASLSAPMRKKTLQYYAENVRYLDRTGNLHQYRPKQFVMHTLRGPFSSQHSYPGSDASSSSSGADSPYCHSRHFCEFCQCSLSSSSDSCATDVDSELGMTQHPFIKYSDKAQPVVNFNDDLEPTYV
nr:PREDICTED: probable G-protein coupled receptor 156 isoform X2 [Anolis carolinensis]|eukprot:XP_008116564.1 PREDICTED: probable G-protein coupled receptor 156 isoform X2 [Anolis carolinensis]